MYANRMNNDMAVSPIVATLVLIVVAVIGAVAVGTIMGTFSTDVSKQANSQDATGASSTEILTAGSTTVQPASEEIAKVFMATHPGVKITVQGGGSGAGFASTKMGVVDIGAMSESAVAQPTKFDATGMDLREFQIGGSGIVVASDASAGIPAATVLDLTADLLPLYDANAASNPAVVLPANTKVVYRSETSGTADTFCKVIGLSGQANPTSNTLPVTVATAAQGNAGALAAIKTGTLAAPAIGYLDMGYAYDAAGNVVSGIKIHNLQKGATIYATTDKANMKTAVKNRLNNAVGTTDYPLARGLYYITKGQPSPIAGSFITFAQSPGATDAIHLAGMFSNADLA